MRSLCATLVALVMLTLGSCKDSGERPDTFFDSLIVAQVKHLSVSNPLLAKTVRMNGKTDSTTFHATEPQWRNELDIFRQLALSERSAYVKSYKIEDGLKDTKSNLSIKRLTAIEKIPIPALKFFYYQQSKNLRRIEATYNKGNALYSTTRHLVLEFEEVRGAPELSSYSVEGVEKMIMSDSVKFSVQSRIIY